MDYLKPMDGVYTIYTRSGCSYCKMVMALLKDENPPVDEVCCDEYIAQFKPQFFQFIKQIAGKEHNTFPIVFLDREFIGGYTETKSFLDYVASVHNIQS
jgi:glutaredoxin